MLSCWAAFALTVAASAQAAYQQVGNFGGNPGELHLEGFSHRSEWPENAQLGGSGGMAVNYTGAGGVPKGTVYVAVSNNIFHYTYVSRYKPSGTLSERWEVKTEEEEASPGYERCGPEGVPASPNCAPVVEGSEGTVRVAVDQATGNVYVFKGEEAAVGSKMLTAYSADGSEIIARFGVKAPSGAKTAETLDMIHEASRVTIAVNTAGQVYVNDVDGGNDNFYHRIMVFMPKVPGDYTEYEYAPGRDINAGFAGQTPELGHLMIDAAGYLYSATSSGGEIKKFSPTQPAQPAICSSEFPGLAITASAVDPLTDELFLYSESDRKVHRMSACQAGKFTELDSVTTTPKRRVLTAMALDPVSSSSVGRPPGVLWASSADGGGGKTKGTSSGTEVESAMGYIFAPAAETPPTVSGEAVSGVTATSARLEGAVDPESHTTAYIFQYITTAAYEANDPADRFVGAAQAPLGETRLEGGEAIPVAVTIGGLIPNSEYHYRIVATNRCSGAEPERVCSTEGEDRTFSTYPVTGRELPDGRGYELVSPVDKNGGQVFPLAPETSSCTGKVECKPGAGLHHFPIQAAPDGEAVVFEGNPFSATEGAVIENEYLARRNPATGWQTVNLTPSLLASKGGGGYKQFSPNLEVGMLEAQVPSLSPEAPLDFTNLYRQSSPNPLALAPLLKQVPPHRLAGNVTGSLRIAYAGASEDLSRIFFAANDELNGEGAGGEAEETNLYEWSAGMLHLVNVGPAGEVLPGASFGSSAEFNSQYLVSRDGTHAFWTSKAGKLYVRVAGSYTLEIPDAGKFLTASADGSRVLLQNGHLYGGLTEAAPTLLADLTEGEGGFEGLAGQSEDLTHIYFVDSATLGDEENAHGERPQIGKPNLFAWSEGTTTYVGTLLAADNEGKNQNGAADWALSPLQRTAEASPGGRWLAFVSQADLTGFNNVGRCKIISGTDEVVAGPCLEAFLYNADTGQLRCASCNRVGASPLGPAALAVNVGVGGASAQPRYLTDSGRLIFETQDSLVPADTNGDREDVYEWEPTGVGSCGPESTEGGCVALISAGTGAADSNFLAMDENGNNVFFTTRDGLVGLDRDELVDLYDARVGGGFPEAALPSECKGEGCQQATAAPPQSSPSSMGVPGESTPKHSGSGACKKGKVKRHGRCVKKHHKKRSHHGKSTQNKTGARAKHSGRGGKR